MHLVRPSARRSRVLLGLSLIILASVLTVIFIRELPSSVKAQGPVPSFYVEQISAGASCANGTISVTSLVFSNQTSLMHFPAGVDMTRPELRNATLITIVFSPSPSKSVLLYEFNTTLDDARSLAATVTPSIENAFKTNFWYNSTRMRHNYSEVSYLGDGKPDLLSYLGWLKNNCLASDLGGFTETFVPAASIGAYPVVSAGKKSGEYSWTYQFGVTRGERLQGGPGTHKMDILELLNVSSLQPSQYAFSSSAGMYGSQVMAIVVSNDTVSFDSCEPGFVSPMTGQLRGWVYRQGTPTVLTGTFTFANDPSPVAPLSFTFRGMVVPEFTFLGGLASAIGLSLLSTRMKR